MRILVTGSEGSLMQAVIPHLLNAGHEVLGVDNFSRYGTIERERKYELVVGDLVDRGFTKDLVSRADGVIQAAARIYGVEGFHKYPADILSHDVTLHQNVLWSAQEAGIRKVAYVSSSMVFERVENTPSKEEDVFEAQIPATDYGLSKLTGERLSIAFAQQYGLNYVIWRPFNIITPHEKSTDGEQGISHVFADFIRMIVHEKRNPLPVLGDGSQIRCFTWIDDIAATIAKYSFDPVTDNEIFNLGNPEPITMAQLAQIIYEEAQAQTLLPRTDKPLTLAPQSVYGDDVKIRVPDVSKAEARLGFAPSKNVRESVRVCLQATA